MKPLAASIKIYQSLGPFKAHLRNGAVAAFLLAGFSLFIPNQFISEVRILPADTKQAMGASSMAAAAAAAGMNVPGQEGSDAAFVDILESRWMRRRLLEHTYTFYYRPFLIAPRRSYSGPLFPFLKVKNMDRAIAELRSRMIKVKRDPKTKLITVSVETIAPELSQQVVHEISSDLELFLRKKTMTKGGTRAAFTAGRLDEAKITYEKSEKAFEAFLSVHRNYLTSNEPAVRLTGLKMESELRLRQQVVTTLTLNYEQALLDEKNDMPILNILDEGDLPIDKSGPSRMTMVVLGFLLTGIASYLWTERNKWLKAVS